ncbi:MAG: TonB family protein [Oceanicoccus sp.]
MFILIKRYDDRIKIQQIRADINFIMIMKKAPTPMTRLPYSLIAYVFLLLGAPMSFSQSDDFDTIPLNGLATYEQLRKQYYVGALYLKQVNQDADAVLGSLGVKRMDVRIVIDKWSPRRFSQQWNQSILINNDQASLEKFSTQILAFLEMPKDNLIAGDRITIDLDPEIGTTVYLNNQKVFTESDNAFFNVLLNTWIGQRPPSTDFKNNILSLSMDKPATEMLVTYESLIPTDGRGKVVAQWIGEPPEVTEAAPNPSSIAAPPGSGTTVTAKRATTTDNTAPSVATQTVVTMAAPAIAMEKPSLSSNQPIAMAEVLPEKTSSPVEKQEPPATGESVPLEPNQIASSISLIPANNEGDTTPSAKPDQTGPMAKYRSQMLNLTYKNTKYPKRAINFKQEGTVVVLVKVDRSGELLEMSQATSTEYKLLNNAALKAVRKTAPYPKVPDDLTGDVIEVSLPFSFKL